MSVTGTRWFAWLYDAVMGGADRVGLWRRRRVLACGARGRVLEVGAGTGLEFRHYPPAARVVAIEPDVAMVRRAVQRQRRAAASISLVVADARALPFRDGTFEVVVSALAFCTIPEPERAAAEMHRVLEQSGTARLLEHVRATHGAVARVQEWLTPSWRRLAGGCHLARRTTELIREAGFTVEVRRAAFDGILVELVARPLASRQGGAGERSADDANLASTALRMRRT